MQLKRDIYQRLNPAQRKAVETTEGPVLVISGPGTGKTELLSARVSHILTTTDTQPEELLCLTYTNAGVQAMRKRLEEMIGAESHKVQIHTFHSFCNEIIMEHQDEFNMAELNAADDLDQIQILESIIEELPDDHELKRHVGQYYYEAGRMKSLFDIMKKEDWSPEDLQSKIRAYLEDLPNRDEYIYKRKYKEFQAGDLKQKKFDEEVGKMAKLQAAADCYPTFVERMKSAQLYDFNDMINWTIKLFADQDHILQEYQEQFRYIMVDEFQDTNGSQLHILNDLTDHLELPNIFAVGDDDQSIYRFQGANLKNIEDYKARFGDQLTQITLTDNYRSTQSILNAAMGVIGNNVSRIVDGDEKTLNATNTDRQKTTILPQILELPNPHQETVYVGQQIKTLIDQGTEASEISVLYRSHKDAVELIDYLKHLGIRMQLVRRYDLFETPLYSKLSTLMQYISEEAERPYSGDRMLFEILHYDFFGLDVNAVAEVFFQLSMKRKTDEEFHIRQVAKNPGVISISGKPEEFKAELDLIIEVIQRLEACIGHFRNESFIQFLQKLYKECGIIASLSKQEDRLGLLQELNTFHAFVEDHCRKQPDFHVKELQGIVRQMQEHNIRYEVERSMADGQGVVMSTIQSAKGLEFEHVFMIRSNKEKWEKKNSGTHGYTLPDNLLATQLMKDEEEERRIFYVGITRAKTNLVVTYNAQDEKEKALQVSQFVSELAQYGDVKPESVRVDEALMTEYLERIEYQPTELFMKYEEAHVDRVLENYSLSVSHLNDYLKCPIEFYYKHILRVPKSQNVHAAYGSAIHYALEQFYLSFNRHPGQGAEGDALAPAKAGDPGSIRSSIDMEETPHRVRGDEFGGEPDLFSLPAEEMNPRITNTESTLDDLLRWFEEDLSRRRYLLSDKEYEQKLAAGKRSLPIYYEAVLKDSVKEVLTETKIEAELERIPINGVMDKLERVGGNIRGVDYKTGKFDSQHNRDNFRTPTPPEKLKEGEDRVAWIKGGNYWRQAVFYKILSTYTDGETLNAPLEDIRFEYVDPDSKGEIQMKAIIPSDEEMQTVITQIKEAWEAIQSKQFKEGCGDPDCEWCKLARP